MSTLALTRRAAKGIAELCLILFITLLLLEAALWVLAALNRNIAFMTDSVISETLPDPVLGVRLNPNYPSHDRDGFRNAEVLQQADIVAIGDSQTYGANILLKYAWPQQLAALSGRSVYNMSVGGYGPVHYLLLTPRALAKHPSWVITGLYDGNDLFDSFDMVYEQKQLIDLASKDAAVLDMIARAQAAERIEDVADRYSEIATGNFHQSSVAGTQFTPPSMSPSVRFFKTHCRTWNLIRMMRRIIAQKGVSSQFSPAGRMVWNSLKKKASNSGGYWLAFENGSARTIFVPGYRELALRMDDPRIAEGARISAEAMKRSQAEAQAGQVKFAVLMIPTKELVFHQAFSNSGDAAIEQLNGLVNMEMRFREQFRRDVCDRGVVCIDPLPALSESLRAGRSPYPMDFDGHPNSIGQAVLADVVSKAIDQHR